MFASSSHITPRKRRSVDIQVLCLVVGVFGLSAEAQQVTIISNTGASCSANPVLNSASAALRDPGGPHVLSISWTQTRSYDNVSIKLPTSGTAVDIQGAAFPGATAYLTTQIGPGTSTSSEVARSQVNCCTVISTSPSGIVFLPIALFSGLHLSAGTYFLTIAVTESPTPADLYYYTCSNPVQTTDTGVTSQGYYLNQRPDIPPPAYSPDDTFLHIGGGVELSVTGSVSAEQSVRSGVLSHIAAGGAWTTVITLVNTSSAAAPVTVAFHNDDGSALTMPVTTTNQGATQTATTSSVNATINPHAPLLISMGDQVASTVVGWADVTSAGPLGGFAIFRQTPLTGSPAEGTVSVQSQYPTAVTLPYDNTAGFVMGVALANLSTSLATVAVTMWDDSGNQLGTQNLTIAGSGHTSFVLPTEFPLTAGKLGTVKFQSGGGLAGLGLRFSPFGTFTSVPTM